MCVVNFVKIRSYGFLFPGRERWRRVIKKSWYFIPGSTLYGAISHAMILADCDGDLDAAVNSPEPQKEWGSYYDLLQLVKERQIRFSPLLNSKFPINNFVDYNAAGLEIIKGQRPNVGTTPHAPIDRHHWNVYEDQLYGVVAHQPFQDYYGFIVCMDSSFTPKIQKALRMLPIIPFSGRGKYTFVEGELVAENVPIEKLSFECQPRAIWALTPIIIPNGALADIFSLFKMFALKLRRYQVWRTGIYFESGEWKSYIGDEKNDHLTPGVLGLAEGTQMILKNENDISFNDFTWGFGNRDWTYLGWGQIIFDKGDSNG